MTSPNLLQLLTTPIAVPVDDATNFPASGAFWVIIDRTGMHEKAICTSRSGINGTTFNLTRPNPVAHSGYPTISLCNVSDYILELQNAITLVNRGASSSSNSGGLYSIPTGTNYTIPVGTATPAFRGKLTLDGRLYLNGILLD